MADDPDEPDIIIDETPEPEQSKATRGPAKCGRGIPVDEARAILEGLLMEIMEEALLKHVLWSAIERTVAKYDAKADFEAEDAVSNMTGNPAKIQAKMRAKKAEILAREQAEFRADLEKDGVDLKAPHEAIKITTGVGKSRAIRRMIAHFIRRAKAKGLPHRVLILLPTHRLASEARDLLPDGITSMIWQGRKADKLGSGDPMCLDHEAVDDAQEIGADVETAACKYKDMKCAFYDNGCHYQAQKGLAKQVDVLLAAHEILFQVPAAFGKNFGLIIIDESFWQDGVRTEASLSIAHLADDLKEFPVRDYAGNKAHDDTEDLLLLIHRLQSALQAMPDGYVQRGPLIAEWLMPSLHGDISSCGKAYKLEWARKLEDTGLRPGIDAEQRKKLVKKFNFLGRLARRGVMWKLLGDLIAGNDTISGHLKIETRDTKEGVQRFLRLLDHKDINGKLINLPIIYADATLPMELSRSYLPDLKLALDLDVAAPHMRITQIVGLNVGKSSLETKKPGKRTGPEETRIGNKRQRLADAVRCLARGRRTLLITHKDIMDSFAGIDGVEAANFGAVEGIDAWRNVEVLITIGRPLPAPIKTERPAAALTGKPVIVDKMVKQTRQIIPGWELVCNVYASAEAELIRQAVAEAAIEQAVGRGRGVNRTASNPLEVYLILSDTVVPGLPVGEVVEFGDIEPDAIDLMIERGWEPQMPADAAKLCPDLFPNREAAKKAYQRDRLRTGRGPRLGTSSKEYLFFRRCPQPPRVAFRFQPCGRGQLSRFCIANLVKIPDPRAALEGALGPLALFEMLTRPEPAAADSEAAE